MARTSVKRLVVLVLIAAALGYVVAVALVANFQEQMIYVGSGRLPELHSPPRGWREVRLPNDVGESVAWYYERPGDEAGPAVIAMHGNGESIAGWPSATRPWIERGYSVLLPELRGYAGVDGPTTADGITIDMVAWRDWLDSRPEVDEDRVAYHGFSLGGGIVGKLAEDRSPALMVLQSTFTDLPSMAPVPMPAFLAVEPYETASVVDGWSVPTVVVHGRADAVIPFEHGEELARRSGGILVAHDGGHWFPDDESPMWRAIDRARESEPAR